MLRCYASALNAVEGRAAVSSVLPELIDNKLSTGAGHALRLVAIGKAAAAMLQGALDCLEGYSIQALLITKKGHVAAPLFSDKRVRCIEAGHPVPDQNSIQAGQVLIDFLQMDDCPCVFLISGGTSSLVEVLHDGWDLSQLQEMTRWMLAHAYDIEQMNSIRQRVSRIKGGGLWRFLGQRNVLCLMISDVPGDAEQLIGSGLLFPVKKDQPIPVSLPAQWRDKLPELPEITVPETFYWQIVANNTMAQRAAEHQAQALGYTTLVMSEMLLGDAEVCARFCVKYSQDRPGKMIIWGAETTVHLPASPGRGGRNQHFALMAAIEIAGKKTPYPFLLAAGTDGTDGMSTDAGALVDSTTVARGELAGLNAGQCLQQADSGRFLCASEDLISTGVTGTNVMDLVIAYCAEDKA